MLFLFNKTINTNKKIKYVLTNIYGLNQSKIIYICYKFGINPDTILNKLSKKKINYLTSFIKKKLIIEKELKHHLKKNMEKKRSIKTCRSLRLFSKLPVNGQRTHSNAKTIRKI